MVLAIQSRELYIGYEVEESAALWIVEKLGIEVEHKTTFCLIGESGCGKSTIGNAIAGLLPPYARARGQLVIFDKIVIDGDKRFFDGVRGKIIVKIPQDPASSLNPFMTIGRQLSLAMSLPRPRAFIITTKGIFPGTAGNDICNVPSLCLSRITGIL